MFRKLHQGLKIFLGTLTLLCMEGCTQLITGSTAVGVLSSNPSNQITLDAAPLAFEQQAGYKLALQNGGTIFQLLQAGEGNLEDDVQVAIRSMVEEQLVLAVIGATTNEATMHATSLVNFFHVPMLVPSADGDNLLPSNNLWAFRLSAPGSVYASYVFGTLLLQPVPTSSLENSELTPQYQGPKLAIIFEENTFGESAAVATARAAMKQSIEIVLYESYTPRGIGIERYNVVAQDIQSSGAQLVYLVCNDPNEAKLMASAFQNVFSPDQAPVFVGMEGGFASQSFLTSKEAENFYIVRQAVDKSDCPSSIDTIYEAQTYGAIFLLNEAIKQADKSTTPQNFLSSIIKPQTDLLSSRREKVRDTLKTINLRVPCIGQVSFDNSGQNKQLQFELLQVKNGKPGVISPENFRKTLENITTIGTQSVPR